MSSPTLAKIKGAYPSKKRPIYLELQGNPRQRPSRPSIGLFHLRKTIFCGPDAFSEHGCGIRLKPLIDKGNFILKPTFSLGAIGTSKRPERWKYEALALPGSP
jgi:hypothetical protein